MVFNANVEIVGKNETANIDKVTGNEKLYYSANISQEDGRIIGTLSVSKEVFDILEKGECYNLKFIDREGVKGLYFWGIDAVPIN